MCLAMKKGSRLIIILINTKLITAEVKEFKMESTINSYNAYESERKLVNVEINIFV